MHTSVYIASIGNRNREMAEAAATQGLHQPQKFFLHDGLEKLTKYALSEIDVDKNVA